MDTMFAKISAQDDIIHMYIDPMLVDCWAIVADPALTLGHPEVKI